MQQVLNPLVNVYQTQLEASRRFADAIFSGTEKIDRVMIGATHRVFTEQLNFVQAIAAIRDPRGVGAALPSGFLARQPDEAVNYQKEIMSIVAEMQSEIGKSMQDCVEQLRSQATSGAGVPGTQEHAGEAAYNPMTSMFSVWESAFKEVAALAKKNMTAAGVAAKDAIDVGQEASDRIAQDAASAIDSAARSGLHPTQGEAIADAEFRAEEKKGTPSSSGKRK